MQKIKKRLTTLQVTEDLDLMCDRLNVNTLPFIRVAIKELMKKNESDIDHIINEYFKHKV